MGGWPTSLSGGGHAFVALNVVGEHLDFPHVPAADTLVVRFNTPDAPAGGG